MQPLNQIQLKFAIKECKCTKFEFTEFAKTNKTVIESDKYQLHFNVNIKTNNKNGIINIEIKFILQGNSDIKENIASLESIHVFNIYNYEELKEKINLKENIKGDGMILPDRFIEQLVSISISNSRGMLAVKLENSIYSNATIPIMDASKLMPKRPPMLG